VTPSAFASRWSGCIGDAVGVIELRDCGMEMRHLYSFAYFILVGDPARGTLVLAVLWRA
jgi:hypothetical protein